MNAVRTSAPARLQIAIWAGTMALGLFLSLRTYHVFPLGCYADDAVYAVLARSLLSDRGFGMINAPGDALPASPYPFGYPMILAPLAGLAPGNLGVLKLPSLVATFANGALLFWCWHWLSRRSRWWGVAVAGLYLVSPTAVSHSVLVMSEAVFTMLCLIAVLLAEQIARGRPALWRAPLLGGVCAYALMTRSAGLVIAPALAIYLLWRMRRAGWQASLRQSRAGQAIGMASAAGLVLTISLLLLAPVTPADLLPARYLTERNNSLYLIAGQAAGVSDVARRSDLPRPTEEGKRSTPAVVLDRAWRHLTRDLRQNVLQADGRGMEQVLAQRLHMPWLSTAVTLLTLGLVVVGWSVWLVKDGMTAFGWLALFYFGASLFWNYAGPRLLLPIAPQMVLCFLIGFEAACRFAGAAVTRLRPTAPGATGQTAAGALTRAFTLGLVVVLGLLALNGSSRLAGAVRIGDLPARTEWLRANTPSSAVLLSDQAATDFLYGGRSTLAYPGSVRSAADLESFLASRRVDYVLVGLEPVRQVEDAPEYSRSTKLLLPLLAELEAAGGISLVYSAEVDRITVYRVESRRGPTLGD